VNILLQIAFTLLAGEDGGGGEGGGSGPAGAPSSMSVYEYSGGTRFGIQCALGDSGATTEWFRDDVLYTTTGAGVSSVDIGPKSGDGTHTWKARHLEDGTYSAFSDAITTNDGVLL
jgi:hypothetical protein